MAHDVAFCVDGTVNLEPCPCCQLRQTGKVTQVTKSQQQILISINVN